MSKEINLREWVKSGEGGNSISYDNKNDDSVILKLTKNHIRSIESMHNEIDIIDKAMALNISTPKMIEKVECNGRIGLIYEKLHNKKSLGKLCHDNPQNIKEYAKEFARETVKIHNIKCGDLGLKNYKDLYIESFISGMQDKIYTKKVIDIIKNEIDDCDTFIHGDLTVGNLVYADNKWYWIDLGRMGYGDPIFDIIDAYFTFNILSSLKFVRDIFHMEKNQIIELWDNFIKEYAYLTNQNLEELCSRAKRISVAYAFKIWATAKKHIPILYQFVHYKARKYYDDMIGK